MKAAQKLELDSLIKSMEADTSQSPGKLVGTIKNCGFLDNLISHRLLFAWGIFNPYGPTWFSLTLAEVPEKSLSLLYIKNSNPFSIESCVHGWVREPFETESLMSLLLSMFSQKGEEQVLHCEPTFIAYNSDSILSSNNISTLMYHAFTMADIKGLDEACDKIRKHWLKPWDRTPSASNLIMSFMEQHSLAEPENEEERLVLLESFAKFQEKKLKNQSPLNSKDFLSWLNLVTDPDHVIEECKQMWVAWHGAIEHCGKNLSSTNELEGLSFHSDLLRNRRDILLLDLDEVMPQGTGLIIRMTYSNAPIVTVINQSEWLEGEAVPVYFISALEPAEYLIDESVFISEFYKETGGLAPMCQSIKGKRTGSFLVVPFLYHMFPSAREFHQAMLRFLNQYKMEFDLQWVVKDCYVMINHEGKDYTPQDGHKSLNN